MTEGRCQTYRYLLKSIYSVLVCIMPHCTQSSRHTITTIIYLLANQYFFTDGSFSNLQIKVVDRREVAIVA